MSRIYSVGHQRLRFLRWNARSSPGEQLVFRDRYDALAFLRRLAHDGDCLAELRRLFAEESGSQAILWVGNASVLEQLATRLVTGAIRVEIVPREPLLLMPAGEAMRSSEETRKVVKSAPVVRGIFSADKWFSIGVYDQSRKLLGELKIDVELGTKAETMGFLSIRTEGEEKATAKVDGAALRKILVTWDKRPADLVPKSLSDHEYVEPFRDDLPEIELRPQKHARLFITTPLSRVRLIGGCYFDTAKCFPVPATIRALPLVLKQAKEFGTTDMMIVGHTDTVDTHDYNRKLSLERAGAVAAFIRKDEKHLLAYFENKTLKKKRWGTREIQHILSALPSQQDSYYKGLSDGVPGKKTEEAIRAFQAAESLKVDGIAGPNTRKKLLEKYIASVSLDPPKDMTVKVHGCGEHFKALEVEKPRDGDEQEVAENRRVEFLLSTGPMMPEQAEKESTSSGPNDIYRKWVPEEKAKLSKMLTHDLVIPCRKRNRTYVIHGTVLFNPLKPGASPFTECKWSRPEGGFSLELQKVHGDLAIWFEWGGQNTHAARVDGGKDLRDRIKEDIKNRDQDPFDHIDLVAHSHGGNVVLEALALLAEEKIKVVKNVVLIATPQVRITYWGFPASNVPSSYWLYYHRKEGTSPSLMPAISGKLFMVYSEQDTVQEFWADASDGVSNKDIDKLEPDYGTQYGWKLDTKQRTPPITKFVDCLQTTNGPIDSTVTNGINSHSVLHSKLMGCAIGWLLEGNDWNGARALANAPETITDMAEQGD